MQVKILKDVRGTREAGRITNLRPESIAKCCRQERRVYKNYIWEYA